MFLDGVEPVFKVLEVFPWWFKVISAAEKAALFPIESFADLLTVMVPIVGEDSRFQEISQRVDALLARRSMGYIVAEKARDRAMALMESKKIVLAIEQLHQAKVNWFTGDAIQGAVLALLALSEAYLRLGLIWAAKYHAFGAVFLITKTGGDSIKRHMVNALNQIGVCQYVGGEWLAFSEFVPLFFVAHYKQQSDPDDWGEHLNVQQTVLHFLLARSFGKALSGKGLADLIEAPFRNMKAPNDLKKEVLNPPLPLEAYESMKPAAIMEKASAELWGCPFSDVGPVRRFSWRALGIEWLITCENSREVIPRVEEFVAVLQISLADFSRVDLCLMPTQVSLNVSVKNIDRFDIEDVPTNSKVSFNIFLPKMHVESGGGIEKSQGEVLAIATSVLIACSCLPDKKLNSILEEVFKRNLTGKAFLVRPYRELWEDFSAVEGFDARRQKDFVLSKSNLFAQREANDLGWIDSPGVGYSKERAKEFLQNRYRRGLMPIKKTIEKLNESKKFKDWVRGLREEGNLDWQIVLRIGNIAINHWVNAQGESQDMERMQELFFDRLNKKETDGDSEFPEELLYGEKSRMTESMILVSSAKNWGLVVRKQTPDFLALKKVLDIRYFQAVDDIPHPSIFDVD